jgi:hypothetical protein
MNDERKQYLKSLSEDYGVPLPTVMTVADLLGETEDYDALPATLADLSLHLYLED